MQHDQSPHKFVKPWGWYQNIHEDEHSGYKVKIIHVNVGQRLSLHLHKDRSEHWTVVKGIAEVTIGKNTTICNKDSQIYIPVKELHRLKNIGFEELVVIETEIGSYLGEDDIVRYEHDYGRR